MPYRLVVATLLLLCGCSGGGGGSAGVTPPAGTTLGMRSAEGVSVQVLRLADAEAGGVHAQVQVALDPGESPVAAVTCWIGGDYDPEAVATAGRPVEGRPGVFDVLLPVAPAAGDVVWVRIVSEDGGVLELGRDAFPL